MCHPFASDTIRRRSEVQVSMNKFATSSRHDQLVYRRNQTRREIDSDSDAMKALKRTSIGRTAARCWSLANISLGIRKSGSVTNETDGTDPEASDSLRSKRYRVMRSGRAAPQHDGDNLLLRTNRLASGSVPVRFRSVTGPALRIPRLILPGTSTERCSTN